jgi:drug/metabolite transporter (DMT)-like permease
MNEANQSGSSTGSQWKGQGAILLTALLWSTSGLFIKLIDYNPLVLSGLRSLIAALFMLAIRKRGGRGRRDWGALAAGGLSYAATMILFVMANKYTASANAILLQYSAPVWAGILGWLLIGEKPRWEHWAALGIVGCGMFLFFRDSLESGNLTGNILALLSGICFGATSVFLRKQKEPQDSMLLSHIFCFIISVPFIVLYPPVLETRPVLALLFMGIAQIGLSSVLFSYGIARVPAVQAMLTAMLEPVLNPVWVLIVTGERPSLNAIAGGCIIVSAVLFVSLAGRRRHV